MATGERAITASIGLAHWQALWHFDRLCGQADHALYQAKRQGKNRVCEAA